MRPTALRQKQSYLKVGMPHLGQLCAVIYPNLGEATGLTIPRVNSRNS
jgi:hypothetical protein